MATVNLVIDVGSSYTTIYKEGEGIVLHEPTMVIVSGEDGDYRALDFGLNAFNQVPDLSADCKVLYPVQEGAVTYKRLTTAMMEYFIKKVVVRADYFFKPKVRAFVNVPCGADDEERKILEDVMYSAGVDETFLLDAPLFAAYGSGAHLTEKPELIVDIGGGLVDIALINERGIIKGGSYGIGGIAVDNGIVEGLESSLALKVGLMTGESLKKEIGSLYENENATVEIFGKNTVSGNPRSCKVTTKHVRTMIEYYYDKIADVIRNFLKTLPEELAISIAENGIIMTGGGSSMRGLEDFMGKRLKANIIISKNAEYCSVLGGANLLLNPTRFNELLGIL